MKMKKRLQCSLQPFLKGNVMPENTVTFKVIARMNSGFDEKFGIPRQAGLVPELKSRIIFEEEYRDPNAVRGIEEFSHIWIIWQFSEAVRDTWSPTIRPPRLGGNERIGVFASRSPFRPNAIGLSCVKLEKVEYTAQYGPVLHVSGADLLNGTPILDIKPYVKYADCREEATLGFVAENSDYRLQVRFPDHLVLEPDIRKALEGILSEDPRPSYQRNPERIYGLNYAGYDIKFRVEDKILTVLSAEKA